MKKDVNPFPVSNYISKEYFCNREEELHILYKNAENNINTTLISPRRLGKTGLILRFFEDLQDSKTYETIYTDIYATRSLSDFIVVLAEAILKKFPEKTGIGKRFMKLLKGLRPMLTFDAVSGYPQVQFIYQSDNDKEHTLQKLFSFLDSQETEVIVAIDEFQQIAAYPEKNVEALLRTYIQQLKNVKFIFSGSQKHTLVEMFLSATRPFFQSTQFLPLEKLNNQKYRQFIRTMFENGKRNISEDCIDYILDWTKGYTFYTQKLCNRLYMSRIITLDTVKSESLQILRENEAVYFQYRSMMTARQWDFLVALAKEEQVSQIYTKGFLQTYKLGTPSSAGRIVEALLNKDMILEQQTVQQSHYSVYDIFLMRWLQQTY